MTTRTIPRAAVENSLKLVRLPLDAAIGLLPGNGTGARPSAKLALDRADAAVRAVAAAVLGDTVLRDDARQRRQAVEKREQALNLRQSAQQKTEQADARLEDRHDQAEHRRARARQQATAQSKDAERKRQEKTRQAEQTERQRAAISDKVEARVEEAVDEQAPKARLQALDTKADAVREKDKALTARTEARRLRDAAGRTKAERKNK